MPDTAQIYFITPVTFIFTAMKSVTQVQCHAFGISEIPSQVTATSSCCRPGRPPCPVPAPCCVRATGGDGGDAGVLGLPKLSERAHPVRLRVFPIPLPRGPARPGNHRVDRVQSAPSRAAELTSAAGRGLLEGRGERSEQPPRKRLAGLAAPRSGHGRKRSCRPCGAGALTHGAQERERERKG